MEEQFYLVWPLALAAMLRAGLTYKRMQILVALGIASVFVWRIHLAVSGGGMGRIYGAPDARADTLLVGCLLGLLWHAHPAIVRRFARLALWPSITLLTFGALFFIETKSSLTFGGYTLVAIACASIVATAIISQPAWLSSRPIVWLGKRSYSLYIWHFFILWLFDPGFVTWVLDPSAPPDLHLLPAALVALGAAELSYRFIEQPFMRKRRGVKTRVVVAVESRVVAEAA
jgi:peptidoglycan/LPS O-acetylase OafA/YrhL